MREIIDIEPSKKYRGCFTVNIYNGSLSGRYSFTKGINCLVRKDAIYRAEDHMPPSRDEFDKMINGFHSCFHMPLNKQEKARDLFKSIICD